MNKPVVFATLEAPDGVHCVDIRQRQSGDFEAALCRRDPEDPYGWRVLDVRPLPNCSTDKAANLAALAAFGWSE